MDNEQVVKEIADILIRRADNLNNRIQNPYFILYLFGKLFQFFPG